MPNANEIYLQIMSQYFHAAEPTQFNRLYAQIQAGKTYRIEDIEGAPLYVSPLGGYQIFINVGSKPLHIGVAVNSDQPYYFYLMEQPDTPEGLDLLTPVCMNRAAVGLNPLLSTFGASSDWDGGGVSLIFDRLYPAGDMVLGNECYTGVPWSFTADITAIFEGTPFTIDSTYMVGIKNAGLADMNFTMMLECYEE